MLNHLIKTAKSHLGNAIQCQGSEGGLSGGCIMFSLNKKMLFYTIVLTQWLLYCPFNDKIYDKVPIHHLSSKICHLMFLVLSYE